MNTPLKTLLSIHGKFAGRGINHEGQAFTGTFDAAPVGNRRGIRFSFEASGDDGTIFHTESSLIGTNMKGEPALWVLSSDLPNGGMVFVFAFGEKTNKNSYREEIRLELEPSLSVRYTYFWGLPGGEFAERSGALMKVLS
jgi:hypothetical protein